MKLIVGLGNPGRRYERTRHNAGFRALDRLADEERLRWRRAWRAAAQWAEWPGVGRLVKPQTYMNRSGAAVDFFLKKCGITPRDLIVVYDDLDLERGRIRVRARGSAGGHNGMRSVIGALGSDDFARVRIGIRGPEPVDDVVAYVLSPFTGEEQRAMEVAIERAVRAVRCMVTDGTEKAMNDFNGE